MKSTRALAIVVAIIMVIVGLVGFFISFGVAPQIAYARLIIDVGALTLLVIVCLTLPKPAPLRTDELTEALQELAKGKYNKRLPEADFGDLGQAVHAFNQLARKLSDMSDANFAQLKQKMSTKEAARFLVDEAHSHHPELGPVIPVGVKIDASKVEVPSIPPAPSDDFSTPIPESHTQENTESAPSILPASESGTPSTPPVEVSSEDRLSIFQEAPKAFTAAQDIYDAYIKILDQLGQPQISFEDFKATIEATTEALIAKHHCKGVKYEVLIDSGEAALRPRLIR